MKSLKNHIFLTFALVSIFFSIEIYLIFNKIVDKYEDKIVKNYSVLVVSKTEIKKLNLGNVLKIEQIDIKDNVSHLKEQLKNFDISKLQHSLPYFYRVYFKKFPTPTELKSFETELLSNKNIVRVESFRVNQNQIYNLLFMIENMSIVFMAIITIIATLLMVKQLEVWRLEHSERMYIMKLFGAPFGLRSAVLLKLAIFDSFLSIIFMFGIIEYILNSGFYKQLLYQIGIDIDVNLFLDLSIFLCLGLFLSFISTLIVVLSKRDETI